jgi:hypothetical protein
MVEDNKFTAAAKTPLQSTKYKLDVTQFDTRTIYELNKNRVQLALKIDSL